MEWGWFISYAVWAVTANLSPLRIKPQSNYTALGLAFSSLASMFNSNSKGHQFKSYLRQHAACHRKLFFLGNIGNILNLLRYGECIYSFSKTPVKIPFLRWKMMNVAKLSERVILPVRLPQVTFRSTELSCKPKLQVLEALGNFNLHKQMVRERHGSVLGFMSIN